MYRLLGVEGDSNKRLEGKELEFDVNFQGWRYHEQCDGSHRKGAIKKSNYF